MDFRHSGVSVTQTQRVKLLGLARDTNTDSQATGSGLSHKHRESSYWVWPVTPTQRVKLLGLACQTNTDSQATGSGLSHQHRESKHWVWPILQRVETLRLAYQTNLVNQPDTGLDLSYKHRVKALGLACHTNTESQGTGSGLSHKHSQSTGSGLSYKRSESTRHRVGPVMQTHSRSTGSPLSHKCRLC